MTGRQRRPPTRACATAAATGPRSVWPTTWAVAVTSRSTTPPRSAWRRPSTSSTRPAPRPRPRTARPSPRARTGCAPLAEDGHDPIIGVGFAYSDAVDAVAPDFPEVSFAVVDGFDPDPDEPNDNVAYLGFAEEEGSFLVGVAAALKTEADHVGFVGGVNNDLIKKFEAGYVAGVAGGRPEHQGRRDLHRGDRPRRASTTRPAARPPPRRCTTAAPTSSTTPPAVRARASSTPRSRPATACGRSVSTPTSTSPRPTTQQPHILTSMLKRVDTATFDMVQSVADGEPLASYQAYDLEARRRRLLHLRWLHRRHHRPRSTSYADQIKSGEIKVPDRTLITG